MWIQREIEQIVQAAASQKSCLVLTGARQTGKSALLGQLYPDVPRVNLDLPRLAQRAETDGEAFLNELGRPLVLDEVQKAPGIFPYIKHVIDTTADQAPQYLLTGSDKFSLMEGVSESLAGRASISEIHTLSVRELADHTGLAPEGARLWEWIFLGGYPELHAKQLPRDSFFDDYVATYLERDVRRVLNVRDLRAFDQFLRLLSLQVGQLLSYHKLAAQLGKSATTIKEWIDVLVVTNVVAIVEPWFSNARKRIVKTPKVFFLDTGLACHLAGFEEPEQLLASSLKGALFENHVYTEMVKACWNQGRRPRIFFFRDHAANEVDFVRQAGDHFELLECKCADNPSIERRGFDAFARSFPESRMVCKYVTPALGRRFKDGVEIVDSVNF